MRDGRESLVVVVLVFGLVVVVGLLSSVFGLLDEDGGGGEDEDGLSLGWDMLASTSPGMDLLSGSLAVCLPGCLVFWLWLWFVFYRIASAGTGLLTYAGDA